MAAPAILKIDILTDASKVASEVGKVEGTGSRLKSWAKGVGAAMAGAFVVDQVKDAVKAASDLNETMSKTEVTFGDSSAAIVKWSETAATKMGLSQQQALEAASSFGTLFTQVGLGGDAAVQMSQGIVGISADLASFHNVAGGAASVTDMIASAMRGEYDSLQKLIPTINAAAVEQKALSMTGKTNAKDLTAAEKAAATYELVLSGAGKATGDFARTSDGLANQQRIANAQWKDMQAQLGNALLPLITKLAEVFTSTVLPAIKALVDSGLAPWLIAAAAAIWLVNAALNANPFVLIAIAVVAFIAGIVLLYQKVGWFRDLIQAVFGWISDHWPLLLAILLGPFGVFIGWVIQNWDKVTNAIRAVVDWIKQNWPLLLAILTGPIGAAVLLITKNWDTIKDAASSLYDWVRGKLQAIVDFFSGLASTIGGFARGIADAIKGPINGVIRAWNSLKFEVPSFDAGPIHIGGQTLRLPHVPELASGGFVSRTGLALVHRGETFSGVGGRLGTTVINVNVTTTGLGADTPEIQRGVVNALRGYVDRNGPLDVPVRSVGM